MKSNKEDRETWKEKLKGYNNTYGTLDMTSGGNEPYVKLAKEYMKMEKKRSMQARLNEGGKSFT